MSLIEKIRDYALSKGYIGSEEEEYEDESADIEDSDDGYEEEPAAKTADKPRLYEDRRSFSSIYKSTMSHPASSARVVSIHSAASSQQTVVITYPESIDESWSICDYIKSNQTVVVNLNSVKNETAQRIVDFMSGVVHALEGDIQFVSSKILILAPKNVEITGKIKDELREGSILSTMKASYR